jgi:hypothetical protein
MFQKISKISQFYTRNDFFANFPKLSARKVKKSDRQIITSVKGGIGKQENHGDEK